ncbi:hypothetical protein Flexsi_1761 [Flexistipes sinusarabici DSM 4947]|uniref:Uncharacterized protein n=1 Tax=Flexistipes sinusarabici (strain ATCC 49648 / DSM 4947 / MAS 10) TaxID=717231 RepID=F8E9Z0_FLESM|nr:hypothetical protein Flexsi_1761 [Flexistipes sinusarabici DSM 4947]
MKGKKRKLETFAQEKMKTFEVNIFYLYYYDIM